MKTGAFNSKVFTLAFVSILFLWVIGIFTPLLTLYNPVFIKPSIGLRFFYHFVCHQLPEKTIMLAGKPLLVCARCTGIYLGAALFIVTGALLKFQKIPLLLILGLAIPLFLDVVRLLLHISVYSKVIAFSTGMLSGCAAGAFILTYLISQLNRKNEK